MAGVVYGVVQEGEVKGKSRANIIASLLVALCAYSGYAQDPGVTVRYDYGVFAVMKVSYNVASEDSTVISSVAGSGFFISDSVGITACHVIPSDSCGPDNGRQRCAYYLVSRIFGHTIPLHWHSFQHIPEIDVTVIRFPPQGGFVQPYSIERSLLVPGSMVAGYGHHSGLTPVGTIAMSKEKIYINQMDVDNLWSDKAGLVIDVLDVAVNTEEFSLPPTQCLHVSYDAVPGMSGGPLLDIWSGAVLGMMSFGLPRGEETRRTCFAVSINRILDELERRGIPYKRPTSIGE